MDFLMTYSCMLRFLKKKEYRENAQYNKYMFLYITFKIFSVYNFQNEV